MKFLWPVLFLTSAIPLRAAERPSPARPNVVVILADDLATAT